MGAALALGVYWAATQGVAIAQGIAAGATAAYHAVVNFLSIGFGILTGNTAAAFLLNEGEINFLRTPGLTEIMVPFTFGGRAGTGGDQPVHALWKRESNTGQSRGTAPQVGEDHGGVQGITVRK